MTVLTVLEERKNYRAFEGDLKSLKTVLRLKQRNIMHGDHVECLNDADKRKLEHPGLVFELLDIVDEQSS